jgi:hypothetical protein
MSTNSISPFLLTFSALCYFAVDSGLTHAQQPSPAPNAGSPKLTLRVYDVRDIVMVVQDHKLDGQKPEANPNVPIGGRMGGGFFSVGEGDSAAGSSTQRDSSGSPEPRAPHPIEIGRLADVVTETVEPNSWTQNGGGDGRIQVLGSSLVVLQRPDVHEQIGQLLHELRDASGARRTLSIDARWLLLSSDDLDRLAKPADNGLLAVDRKVLAEYTRQAGNLRAITNCFSGQQVYLISGLRRNVVSGYIPVVGSIERPADGEALMPNVARVQLAQLGGPEGVGAPGTQPIADKSVGYQPIVQTTNFGVQLEIRPTLQMDKTAVVDLKSTVTFPDDQAAAAAVDPATAPGMMASPAPTVDRLSINALELATTMIVPLGQPVLVGGMTHLAAGPEAATVSSNENRQLYLILELR